MEAKTMESVAIDIKRAQRLYEELRAHFEGFRVSALTVSDPKSPVKDLTAVTEGDGLLLSILDRRIQVNFRFDRKKSAGVIHVEDASLPSQREGDAPIPRTIKRIPFERDGSLGIPGGYTGGGMNLGLALDRFLLALCIVDWALDYDPWA